MAFTITSTTAYTKQPVITLNKVDKLLLITLVRKPNEKNTMIDIETTAIEGLITISLICSLKLVCLLIAI